MIKFKSSIFVVELNIIALSEELIGEQWRIKMYGREDATR